MKKKELEIRTCALLDCDITFECKIDSKKRFCSRACSNKDPEVSKRKGQRQHKLGCGCCICKNKRHEPKSEEHKKKIGLSLVGKNKKPKPPGFGAIMSEATTKSWQNPKHAKTIIESWHRKPNKPERWLNKFLQKILPGEYQLNVNAEVMILGGKIPDFVNINGQKKIMEFNGGYWHGEEFTGRTKKEEEEQRASLFAQFDWKTLIIWEYELEDTDLLMEKIMSFHSI